MFGEIPYQRDNLKKKQNVFSAKWFEKYQFLECRPKTDRAFCFTCCLFGDGAEPTKTKWSTEGVNRWDKMKSWGKKRAGKLEQHFTSASHKLSAEKFHSFNKKDFRIDVALSARMQKLAVEEQERLHACKVIALLLDCCRCLARQSVAFRGSDDDADGNFRKIVELMVR